MSCYQTEGVHLLVRIKDKIGTGVVTKIVRVYYGHGPIPQITDS